MKKLITVGGSLLDASEVCGVEPVFTVEGGVTQIDCTVLLKCGRFIDCKCTATYAGDAINEARSAEDDS